VFASADTADRWFKENDPEGVAWEYEVEGGPAAGSVWLYSPDPGSRDVGDVDWVRLFASKESANKWVEANEPNRDIWEYPVQSAPQWSASFQGRKQRLLVVHACR
jgi:hypothetical protein